MGQRGRCAGVTWGVVCAAVLCGQASAGVLTGAGVIPNPFSPNADALYDSTAVHYTLSDTAAVIVSVADSSLTELATLWSGWEGVGIHRHWWDGRLGGTVAPDGEYAFVVTAVPQQGGVEQVTARFRLDTAPPVVQTLNAYPARFSPDSDGVADTLVVSGTVVLRHEGDRVRVSAADSAGSPVREILAPSGSDSFRVLWDGRTDSASTAADGLYFIVAEAWDLAGNSSETSLLVDLDTAPPLLGAFFPDQDVAEFRVADTLAVVDGWAFDRAGVRAVEISRDAVTWIDAAASGADTVRWSRAVACTACVPGGADETATVRVRAYDGAATADGLGHVNATGSSVPILSFPVVFDVAGPIHQTSALQGGTRPFTAGQMITISTRWDAAGYDLAGDFSRVDSEFDAGDEQVTDSGGGIYLIKYTTSTSNTLVPVTDARVVITASDAFARAASDSSVTVSIASGSSGVAAFALDRNSFDPSADESVTIGLGSGPGAAKVEIYNMAGTLVRTIEVEGETSAVWDGRNDDGDALSSGAYFVRILTDAGEAVRKVALVK
jgi:hypothetical protein